MHTRHLEFFLAVIARGTFSGAAAELGVSQPALSQAIASLEGQVGTSLFVRSPHGARPTRAGREFEVPARAALAALRDAAGAARRADRIESGALEIACHSTLAIDPTATLAGRFHRRYGDVTVRIRDVPERDLTERALFDLGVDLAIIFGELADPSMTTVPLPPLELAAVLPAPADLTTTLEEVIAHGLVTTPVDSASRIFLSRHLESAAVDEAVAVEVEYTEAILPLVINGAGAAIVPARHAAAAASLPGLTVCELVPRAELDVAIAVPTGTPTAAAAAFIALATDGESR